MKMSAKQLTFNGKVFSHGNQRGDAPRVRIQGGPFVDPTTRDLFLEWNRAGASIGAAIDSLVAYALRTGFDPSSDITKPTARKNRTPAMQGSGKPTP